MRKVLEKSVIQTPKKRLTPYTHKQATYMDALMSKELVFAAGPAGTGKTYIAVAAAVAMLWSGRWIALFFRGQRWRRVRKSASCQGI